MLQWRVVVTGVLIALVGFLALAIITTLEPPAEVLVTYAQASGGYDYTIVITPSIPPIPFITPTIEQVKALVGSTPIECQVSPKPPITLARTVVINIHCPVLVGRIIIIMDSGEYTISIGYSSGTSTQSPF
jgi:hypothetical protein